MWKKTDHKDYMEPRLSPPHYSASFRNVPSSPGYLAKSPLPRSHILLGPIHMEFLSYGLHHIPCEISLPLFTMGCFTADKKASDPFLTDPVSMRKLCRVAWTQIFPIKWC